MESQGGEEVELALGRERGPLHSTEAAGEGGRGGASANSLRKQGQESRALTWAAPLLKMALEK